MVTGLFKFLMTSNTKYNKQPMRCDAKPAGTQTGSGRCPGRGRNVYGKLSSSKMSRRDIVW